MVLRGQGAPAGRRCFRARIFPRPIRRDEVGMIDGPIPEGLTFDDLVLLPGKSSVLPTEADTRTCFTRKLPLDIPLPSAAMYTVPESRLAIALPPHAAICI